jgi:predicted GNAT family N-acyltransferase
MSHYDVRAIAFASPEYDQAVALRYEVLRKPLGLEFTVAELSAEFEEFHFGCYDAQNDLCGCLTYHIYDATTLKMRQVAVAPSKQGIGIGKILVGTTEAWARHNGWQTINLHARLTAVPFYEKLQYEVVGKAFKEVGVPHYKMLKNI